MSDSKKKQFTMDEAREVIRNVVAEHEMDVNLDRVRVLPAFDHAACANTC